MQTTYRPGQWFAIVLPDALVVLPSETPADVVTRLWERMPDQPTLATVVDVLTGHAGGVFSALPSFVAAVAEATGIRIALRGAVSAQVSTAAGRQELSGADVTTWSERFVGSASIVEVTVQDAPGEVVLPVRSGVVRAGSVTAELEYAGAHPSIVADAAAAEELREPSVEAPVTRLGEDAGSGTATTPEPEAEPAPEPEPEPAPEPEPEPEVDAEPAPLTDDAHAMPSEVTLAPSTEDFDALWGTTVHAAPAAEPSAAVPAPVPAQGDHDGATVSVAELRALRQAPSPDDVPTAAMPTVPAATGRIRVSTGQVVTLDRTVIIGRRPRSTRASGANLPHLIAVDSPQQDISRSHLEIRPEGDTVVIIDLHTTNGSTLIRAGADPMRLHPGEQTLVVSGDVVDLGDGVEVVFEDLP